MKSNRPWAPSGRRTIGGLALVLLSVMAASGCTSRAAMQRMQEQIDYLEASQRRVERDIIRMDSLVTGAADESRRTRAEVATTLDDLREDSRITRESIDELRRAIDRHPPQIVYRSTEPSPGEGEESTTGSASPSDAADINPSQLYENAFLDVRKGNYELAIAQFRDILQYFGDTEYAPNARYWIGECWYSLAGTASGGTAEGYYDSSIVEFEYLIANHSESDRVPTSLYKLGRCYEELGRTRRACNYYDRLINEFPKALEIPPAKSRRDALDCR